MWNNDHYLNTYVSPHRLAKAGRARPVAGASWATGTSRTRPQSRCSRTYTLNTAILLFLVCKHGKTTFICWVYYWMRDAQKAKRVAEERHIASSGWYRDEMVVMMILLFCEFHYVLRGSAIAMVSQWSITDLIMFETCPNDKFLTSLVIYYSRCHLEWQ